MILGAKFRDHKIKNTANKQEIQDYEIKTRASSANISKITKRVQDVLALAFHAIEVPF